jgi:Flp pilus assembly pilin Flp
MAMSTTKSRRLGQGLVEYLMLVGMVGVLFVGAAQVMRNSIGKAFGTVTKRLEGVGHKISGSLDTPSTCAPATPVVPQVRPASRTIHVGAHAHTFTRQIIVDASGHAVSADVCTECGEVR